MDKHTRAFLYNWFLMFLLNLVVSSFFKHAWTGSGIMFAAVIIISYVSASKAAFRGQPLLPEDFMLADQAGTLTKFIDFGSLIRTVLAVILALSVTIILNITTKKIFEIPTNKEPKNFMLKNHRILRIFMAVIGIWGFMNATDFARNHSGVRTEYVEILHQDLVAWNQMINYEENGFIIGFMYNLNKFELTAPDGYSEEKVAEIKTLATEQQEKSTNKNELKDKDYNIVVILNESFFDPSVLADYYPISTNNSISKNAMGVPVTEDVIPNIRKLIESDKDSKKVATGQMYTTDYGGGTANIEFEVDTGLTNYWANTVPYVDLLPQVDRVSSVYSVAKEVGYKTLAIHPFGGGMYKRNLALPKEGIDEFITETEMDFSEIDDRRHYINDRSAYNQVLKALEDTDDKIAISLITMQNHAGYVTGDYIEKSYRLADAPKSGTNKKAFTDDEKSQVEIYLESLHNADYYLGEFLEKLENLDEKTVILFYGDHAPGIYSRVNDSTKKEIRDLARVTPYFIWTNAEDLKDVDYDVVGFNIDGSTLPTTTPNCLTNTLFDALDLKKPLYLEITDMACKDTPILAQAYYGADAPFNSTALMNYQMVTYDILGGKHYWDK